MREIYIVRNGNPYKTSNPASGDVIIDKIEYDKIVAQKQAEFAEQEKLLDAEMFAIQEKEKVITAKMRKLAIAELQVEGVLNGDEELITAELEITK